jgi:hypothetical protein
MCGGNGQQCCQGNTCNGFGATCQNGICTPAMMCGGNGQQCCQGNTCNGQNLMCVNGVCKAAGGQGATGDPCALATDCAGTKPVCITKDAMGIAWPGGYCTSSCNPQLNDQNTGLNAACPGGAGTCLGNGTTGTCETACTAMNGAMPCTRQGYLCFQGCEPAAESMCNPTLKGQCGNGMACVRIGSDDVGSCAPACNPFQQGCANINNMTAGCYASDDNGEGVCSAVFNDNMDGVACLYLNDCHPGLGCYLPPQQQNAVCRPYCGGPNNVPCTNGHVCVDLSMNVKVATVGVCGG